jgi:hypothetical protein
MLPLHKILLGLLGVGVACSCSSSSVVFGTGGAGSSAHGSASSSGQGNTGSSSSSGLGGAGSASTSSASSSGHGGGNTGSSSSSGLGTTTSASSSSGGSHCVVTDPNVDMDGDGWSQAQGDCNDCDPTVNPGAVDVPGDPGQVDHDCDGKYDPPVPCDTGLALDDVVAADAAKAIELCQVTTASPPLPQRIWGVISSAYVRADGTAFAAPGLQVGIESGFGTSVNPQGGENMLTLSSGHARTTAQAGACGSNSCSDVGLGTAPPGFPQTVAGCAPATTIDDDVGLQLDIRTPTNATGYAFSFKFYTMEFPYWVCQPYTDQFIALVSPAPAGALDGNISFDARGNPIGSMISFLQVCDPTQIGVYATGCLSSSTTCPSPPNPYCPSGTAQLQGTGFDVWDTGYGGGGATLWLTSQAPVQGGEQISLRFAIWDGGDQEFDSTVLVDDMQWITSGTVPVATTAIANPK